MNHHDQIQTSFQGKCACVDNRSQLPFEAVANDRPFQASSGSKADARGGLVVCQHPNGEQRSVYPTSPSVDVAECLGELQPCRGRTGALDEPDSPYAGMSCRRPFRRRRLSALRPPRELMRRRNPCTRFRLRFDVLRKVFFIVRIIRARRFENQGEIA